MKTKFDNKDITYIPKQKKLPDDKIKELFLEHILEENFFNFYVRESIHNENLIRLQTYRYSLTKKPIAAVIHLHGYTSNNQFNSFYAKQVAEMNMVFLSYDYRGHGKSEGMSTHFDHIEQLMEDARLFVTNMKKIYPGIPFFCGGISLGGLITFNLSLEDPKQFIGVYFFAPAFRSVLWPIMQKLVFLMSHLLPNFVLPRYDNLRAICGNEISIKSIQKDPFYERIKINFKSSRALLKAMKESESKFEKFDQSFVIFMGGFDKLVNPNVSLDFIQKSPSKDKHLYFYEKLYHNVMGDEEFFDISERLKQFFVKKLKPKF